MIKAVVFDVGGVLEIVDDASWPRRWLERWQTIGGRQDLDGDRGAAGPGDDSSERQVREFYRARFGLSDAQADAMMAELWDSYCGRLDIELRNFLAGLRPHYRTAILSNSGDGARREEQRRYDFAGLVDVIVYSHEVGVAKPDPAIYHLTAAMLDVRPHEIVYLDDSIACVDGAVAVGWHAVQHVDTASSISRITTILERYSPGSGSRSGTEPGSATGPPGSGSPCDGTTSGCA
jgi:HAD superfamily hydrolase (TIGR01509 family)